jgi:PPOX class probable F420-dependent enzyme
VGRSMDPDEIRQFLLAGTRTAKVAFVAGDGAPRVTPIWFVLDDERPPGPTGVPDLLFNTGVETAKGRAFRRDPRVAVVVDDDRPPFSLVRLHGAVELSEDLDAGRHWATRIGARYMGLDRAEEFGRRNGVPGEYLVRLRPTKVTSEAGVAD